MRLPFVSRARFVEVEAMSRGQENLRQFDQAALVASEKLRVAAEERLAVAEAERRVLLDRIVELSGQPPIYAAAPHPGPVGAVEPKGDDGPPPMKERILFDDVHAAIRQAMADGTFSITKAAVN